MNEFTFSRRRQHPAATARSCVAVFAWLPVFVLIVILPLAGCGRTSERGDRLASEEEIQQAKELREKRDKEEKKEAKTLKKLREEGLKEKKMRKQAAREKESRLNKERKRKVEIVKRARNRREDSKPRHNRPDNIADWKKDDYYSAKSDRDPRFADAVRHLAENFVGSPNAARLLVNLLAPAKAAVRDPDDDEYSSRGSRISPAATRAIVVGLATNGSDVAREALEQLLLGTLATGNDRVAREAALESLASSSLPTSEALLFRALKAMGERTEPDDGPRDLDRLQKEILDVIDKNGSEHLRIMLAEYLNAPTITPAQRKLVTPLLEKPRPENLGAQIVLFQGARIPQPTNKLLQGFFITYSSTALQRLLNIPEETATTPRRQRLSGKAREFIAADRDLTSRVARQLWNKQFAASISSALYQVDSLDEHTQLLCLASTLPMNSVRAGLYSTLKRNWRDGPKGLESAGFFEGLVNDPGLMLILKMMPDRQLASTQSTMPFKNNPRQRTSSRGKKKSNSSYKLFDGSDLLEARNKHEELKADWLEASGHLLMAVCKRFEAAALARKARAAAGRGTAGPGTGESKGGLPLELHKGARIVAEYHLKWPDDLARSLPEGSAASLNPLRLHFVRIEEVSRSKTIVAYYRRRLGSAHEYGNDRGVWLSALGDGSFGTKVSTDVILRWTEKRPAAERKEKLSIEILWIEAGNPASEQ